MAVAIFITLTHITIAQTKLQTGIWRGALKTESGTDIPWPLLIVQSVLKLRISPAKAIRFLLKCLYLMLSFA